MHTMKKVVHTGLAVRFAILMTLPFVGVASAQVKGCTEDIRTEVCNRTCSVSHVEGCTLEQLKSLLLVQSVDCLAEGGKKAMDGHADIDQVKAMCQAQFDKAIADWKSAQKKKTRK
jgi:hypothetical protein